MRKLRIVVGLLVAFALLAVACAAPAAAPPAPTKAPAAPAPPKAPEKPAVEKPAAPAPPAPKKQYLMGTTQQASSYYIYWTAVGRVINAKVPEVNITQVETGAAVENANRIGKGEFDLGLLTTDVMYRALNGMGPWEGKPIKEVRGLWIYIANPVAYIVREDSGVKKVEDLDGKDFNPGMRGSATESQTKIALETVGIKPKWYVGGTEDALAAIKDRRIVGYTKAHPAAQLDASIMDLMVTTPIRVVGLTKEHVDKVLKAHPYWSSMEIAAGTYKYDWNKEPIRALALVQIATAHQRVPEDIAHKITKAIVEDQKPGGEGVQSTTFTAVKGLDFAKLTVELTNVPLHSGAYKYFKELGYTLPEAALPPELKR